MKLLIRCVWKRCAAGGHVAEPIIFRAVFYGPIIYWAVVYWPIPKCLVGNHRKSRLCVHENFTVASSGCDAPLFRNVKCLRFFLKTEFCRCSSLLDVGYKPMLFFQTSSIATCGCGDELCLHRVCGGHVTFLNLIYLLIYLFYTSLELASVATILGDK